MTETPSTFGNYDLLGERRQEGISFSTGTTGTGEGLKVPGVSPRKPFARAAEKPVQSPATYDGQDFISKFLINILLMLTGALDPDNKGNNPLMGLISKAFGMQDDGEFSQFRQLQNDVKTRGREAVRGERDYSRFDKGAAVEAAKVGEPILGKNIYNSQMLELIGKHESAGDYNRVFAHKGVKRVDLTNMTIDQVQAWQRSYVNEQAAQGYGPGQRSAAAGKYQFVTATLAETAREMGLKGNEKFDEALQDRMAMHLLNKRGYKAFMDGRISEGEMVNRVAGTWASLKNTSGRGTYDGDGVNNGVVSAATTIGAARQDKTILTAGFDAARTNTPPTPPPTNNPIIVAGNTAGTETPATGRSQTTRVPGLGGAPVI